MQAFKNDTLAAEAPSAGVSKDDVNKVGVDLEALKEASEAYIQNYVKPLNRATLRVVSSTATTVCWCVLSILPYSAIT